MKITARSLLKSISTTIKHSILSAFDYYEKSLGMIDLSKKIKSEILSQLIGQKIKEIIENQVPNHTVYVGKSDNDNDIKIIRTGDISVGDVVSIPLEIKVTCSSMWRGGEFSMRECNHLMVYWNNKNGKTEIFACICNLKKEDWNSQIDIGYYAPTLHRWELAQDNRRIDIIGTISDYYLDKADRKYVNVVCEEVTNSNK